MIAERAELLALVRSFLAERGVLEVQSPVLGAATVTEPELDSIRVPGHGYLQTSPEYFLKRLLADGAPDVYQLGPVFRDGERGRLHNPEFTMLEWYRLGWDDEALMREVAELASLALGPAPVSSVRYSDLVDPEPGQPLDLAYALACERLSGRWFVTHFPADQAALARLHDERTTAARFELIVDGVELANGYHEANDAGELRGRFEADNRRRAELGKPLVPLDEPFLEAMSRGLPDCSGVSVGFDRLLMLRLGADSLDAVMPFRS